MDEKKSRLSGMTTQCLNHWFIALTCLLGKEHVDWFTLMADRTELLDDEWCLQN